ncbi:MAG TPA: HD domain-containing protein [Candidatus Hydrogenedentes bacterium]|nr:HD domain-containing protein [Candidatus Hydrogenedentota bacterium]HOL77769.1 HD domain-containing protein [Candidatus Hydrogenedentota bacterium]HPO86417.1 HD domain-containing protein [Candidatus Hydrogenedentota bacterium]
MSRERIVGLSGPVMGIHLELVGTLTIGRSRESNLLINDPLVSRKHAMLQQTPNGTILRDLGSGNGTYVGQRRVIEYKLSPGDIITIGPAQLRFEVIEKEDSSKVSPDDSVVFEAGEDSTVTAAEASNVYETFFKSSVPSATVDQLREAQSRLEAVYKAAQIISHERNIAKLLRRIMDELFDLVPAHNGVILLKDEKSGTLKWEHVKTGSGQDKVMISSSIVRRAFENREAVLTHNAAKDDRFLAGASIIAHNITSAMCVPLEHFEETLGVIYVDTRGTSHAFHRSDLELMVALARAAAIAIRNAQYLRKVEKGYHDTLVVLANTIEMRDHYTIGHTWRVTHFAVEIGRKLGWTEEKLRECEMGGILHDVGKIAIDDAILRKAGKLTDEEFAKMKIHPERGARMMQDEEFLTPLIPYALYHHERWDGKGYPFGLAGQDIPIEGRVIAVADTYDAMTSNRPYRKGLDPEVAVQEIIKGSGTQFDPACVEALVECHRDGSILQILQNYFEREQGSIVCPFCSTYVLMPPGTKAGDVIICSVCHRRIRVQFSNEAFFGELLPETDVSLLGGKPPERPTRADN